MSFLVIKTFQNAFSQEIPAKLSLPATSQTIQQKEILDQFKDTTKKLEKKYQGKDGAKRFQKDAEEKIHDEIKNIRDYNEKIGNKNVLQIIKTYDRNVVRENIGGKEVVRFKTLDELKKEISKNQKLLFKKDTKRNEGSLERSFGKSNDDKSVNPVLNAERSSKGSVEFNYQLSLKEEKTLSSQTNVRNFEKNSHQANLNKETRLVSYFLIFAIIFIAGFFLWKKFFTK